jgi:Sulfotransferase family
MRRYFTPTFLKASLYYFLGRSGQDPIFIVGSGRCGSSLLVDILKSNDNIKISQREWYGIFLKKLKDGYVRKVFLTDIIDFKVITKESLESWTSLDRFFIKVMLKYFASYSDKKYILKSPAISLMLPYLEELFPKAKYIHLYRNGYAVVLSLYKKEYFREKRYRDEFTPLEFKELAAQYWTDSLEGIQSFFKTIDIKRYLELSYECFCEEPVYYGEQLASFIGTAANYSFDFSTVKSTNYKIEELNQQELTNINLILNEQLALHNYEPIY